MESNGVKNRVHMIKATMDLAKPIIENMKNYIVDKNNTKLLASSEVIMNASPKTHDSSATNMFSYTLLQNATITERGKIPIKGKGEMETFFVERGTDLVSLENELDWFLQIHGVRFFFRLGANKLKLNDKILGKNIF